MCIQVVVAHEWWATILVDKSPNIPLIMMTRIVMMMVMMYDHDDDDDEEEENEDCNWLFNWVPPTDLDICAKLQHPANFQTSNSLDLFFSSQPVLIS